MLCGCENDNFGNFGQGNCGYLPPVQSLEACGFDPSCYISTAGLSVVPYTNQASIIGRVGGNLQVLIPATDDDGTGNINQPIFDSILANVTSEINGYISSIYPIPLAKIGTVAILQITAVDSNGAVTAIKMLANGGYQASPSTTNAPTYLRYINPLAYGNCWGWNWDLNYQTGSGLSLTVTLTTPTSVTPQTPIIVNGTPSIAAGGTGYAMNQVLVLTGGSSFVPDKIQNAANLLFCYELLRRRLVPDERNQFGPDAIKVKEELMEIGNGEKVMDGTYRDFYSPVAAWVQQSVLLGNSL